MYECMRIFAGCSWYTGPSDGMYSVLAGRSKKRISMFGYPRGGRYNCMCTGANRIGPCVRCSARGPGPCADKAYRVLSSLSTRIIPSHQVHLLPPHKSLHCFQDIPQTLTNHALPFIGASQESDLYIILASGLCIWVPSFLKDQ